MLKSVDYGAMALQVPEEVAELGHEVAPVASNPADAFLWGNSIPTNAAIRIFSTEGRRLIFGVEDPEHQDRIRVGHLTNLTYNQLASLGIEPEIPGITQFLQKTGNLALIGTSAESVTVRYVAPDEPPARRALHVVPPIT